jgi:ATP phosphoribosyltransferase regulatory subunit
MTFEGYAADLGFPVASGGRYDNLLKQFGRPAPATGFALKTTRILELIDDGATGDTSGRILVGYDADGRASALLEAHRLREAGAGPVVTEKMDETSRITALKAADGAAAGGEFVYKGVTFTGLLTFFGQKGAAQ